MDAYKIKKGTEFAVQGENGTYTLPRMSDLTLDDVEVFMQVKTADSLKEKLGTCKSFLLKYAPELEAEGLGDMGYIQIFNAYADAQGATLGKF